MHGPVDGLSQLSMPSLKRDAWVYRKYQDADRQSQLFVDFDADPGALSIIPVLGGRIRSIELRMQADLRPFVLTLRWVSLSAESGLYGGSQTTARDWR